jgi:hypothetical protein
MNSALIASAALGPNARRARMGFVAAALAAAVGFAGAPAQAALGHNSLSHNSLAFNAINHNALTSKALAPAGSDLDELNGVRIDAVTPACTAYGAASEAPPVAAASRCGTQRGAGAD